MSEMPKVNPPLAREFMQTQIFTVAPGDDIQVAVAALLRHGYSGAPVVDAGHHLVSVLSEWDCARLLSEAAYERWPTGTVADHMTTPVEQVGPETDLFSLLDRFAAGDHRRFPVVDQGRLVGLITRRDLLRALFTHANARPRPASTYEILQQQRSS